PHGDRMALVGWDEGLERLLHRELPEHSAHHREVRSPFDLDHLRGWWCEGPHPFRLALGPSLHMPQRAQEETMRRRTPGHETSEVPLRNSRMSGVPLQSRFGEELSPGRPGYLPDHVGRHG